jgi:hypothetical protein
MQVHLTKRLPNGERRTYNISEEEFHEMSFEFRGFTGAMLANLVNTAVILAAREGRTVITFSDLTRVRSSRPPKTLPEILALCHLARGHSRR